MGANETRSHRAARALQRSTGVTYQQALAQVRAGADGPAAAGSTLSVYVTTSGGQLGEIVVDGDVVVIAFDWDGDETYGTAAEVVAATGVRDGMPAGLIDAVVADIEAGRWTVEDRPEPGEDRPWAYVTFSDQTFASEGTESSPEVTVVYHDWSLWFADLAIGCEPHDIADLRLDAGTLGPNGRAVADARIADYAAEVAVTARARR